MKTPTSDLKKDPWSEFQKYLNNDYCLRLTKYFNPKSGFEVTLEKRHFFNTKLYWEFFETEQEAFKEFSKWMEKNKGSLVKKEKK